MSAKLDIEIDPTALGIFEIQLENTDNAVQQLAAGVDFAKTILNSLDPNSEEFAALSQNINIAEAALKEFENEVVKTKEQIQNLLASFVCTCSVSASCVSSVCWSFWICSFVFTGFVFSSFL